jgi:hypothetical protein
MYQENYQFHTPDKVLTIWKYMDFTKFLDLLVTSQLFLCRSDKFQDPFEGHLRTKDYDKMKFMHEHEIETKKFYFLNCWHIAEKESDAMWKAFVRESNGIAVKTTVNSLIDSLSVAQEEIYIGKVYYRDYEQVTFNDLINEPQNQRYGGRGSSLNQFNYKRIQFEHEKELRLYYIDMPIPHAIKDGIPREPLGFKKIEINLGTLVHEIVISPFADPWFKDIIEQLFLRFDLPLKVSNSALYHLPA